MIKGDRAVPLSSSRAFCHSRDYSNAFLRAMPASRSDPELLLFDFTWLPALSSLSYLNTMNATQRRYLIAVLVPPSTASPPWVQTAPEMT